VGSPRRSPESGHHSGDYRLPATLAKRHQVANDLVAIPAVRFPPPQELLSEGIEVAPALLPRGTSWRAGRAGLAPHRVATQPDRAR
jgi:hypothetical protein